MLLRRRCFLETYCNCSASYSIYKQSKMLLKMMDNDKHKKQSVKQKQSAILANHPFIMKKEIPSIRMATLNKTFMAQVTSIMASGKNSYKLQNLGIEVTKVEVNKNFNFVRVFWISNKNVSDIGMIENVLQTTAGELKHEISSLRFMGRWPEIKFVRDVCTENYMEMEKLFDSLDLSEKLQDSNLESSSDVKHDDNEFLPMRHDLFGLNHSEIMARVKAKIEKKKAISIEQHDEIQPVCRGVKLIPFDKSTFSKYYARQRILQKKLDNQKNLLTENYDSDDDFIENEKSETDQV